MKSGRIHRTEERIKDRVFSSPLHSEFKDLCRWGFDNFQGKHIQVCVSSGIGCFYDGSKHKIAFFALSLLFLSS